MKHFILISVILFSLVGNSFALDEQSVKVKQSAQIPGGTYVECTTPQLPLGKINLKYDFTVDANDDEDSVIDCVIKFPLYFDVELLSHDGIQGLILEDGEVAPIIQIYDSDYNSYCEFLIPQKSGGTGFLEFQVKITENYVGKNIPVTFSFEHFERPFFNKWGTAIGIGVGIVAGIAVGVCTFNPATGASAGIATSSVISTTGFGLAGAATLGTVVGLGASAGGNYVANKVIQKTLQELKNEYNAEKMNDSYVKFVLQPVRK